MRSLTAWCVMTAGVLFGIAGSASAQTVAPPPAEEKGYVEAFAQSAFGNVTSQSYGGEVGVTIHPHLQVFGEFGIIRNVATTGLSANASLIAGALATLQSAAVDFTVKEPVTFGAGGVRYLIPTTTKLQPYVLAGGGAASVKKDVKFSAGGADITSSLASSPYYTVLGSDLAGTVSKPMITAGGGVVWHVASKLRVDLGYRFGRIMTETTGTNVSRAGVGLGITF